MICVRFADILADFLDNNLSAEDLAAALDHVERCAECRKLLEIARGGVDILPARVRQDFSNSVLARTSGAACSRVEPALWEFVEKRSVSDDADLIAMHLEHCPACSSIAAETALLQELLPAMALIDPGESFTESVVGFTRMLPRPRPPLKARFQTWWQGMVQRPLFSLEAAYVATLFMFFIFSPVLPFRGMAIQKIPAIWVQAKEPASSRIHHLASTVSRGGSEFTGLVSEILESTGRSMSSMLGRSVQAAEAWQKESKADLGLFWQRLSKSINKK
jgi:hypothetical protein